MQSIALDTMTPLSGGRIYFFVEPNGQPGPSLPYSGGGSAVVQPTDPPNSNIPDPFAYVEFTVDGTTNNASDIHIDVSQVDGLFFPLTLTEYQGSQTLGQVGQPTNNSAVNLEAIIAAYTSFMNSLGAAGQPYLKLLYSNGINGQSGIVNPGAYLGESGNAGSPLIGEWNNDWAPVLNTLFDAPSQTISLIGPDGDYYQGTSVNLGIVQNPLYVLQFTGYTDPSLSTKNGYVFNIYNPATPDPSLGLSSSDAAEEVFANNGVFSDTSSNVILSPSPLLPPAPLPPPSPSPSPAPSITQQPASEWASAGSTVKFTATASGTPTPSVQWYVNTGSGWSALSDGGNVSGSTTTTLQLSNVTTSMNGYDYEAVFTNSAGQATAGPAELGVVQGLTPPQIVAGLENNIAAALNRGVALEGLNPTQSGGTSSAWNNEHNWYPALTAGNYENLFALFQHTATINGTPIFTLPSNWTTDAQGAPMAQAYGFAYDENPPTGPNVPSKFDGANTNTTSIAITLGPWFETTPPPSPSPSPSASSGLSPTGSLPLLFLAEDKFSLVVDSMASMLSNNPLFTQAADRAMSVYNDLLHLDNPALYTGLSGLQSALYSNPYNGTLWGMVGQAAGMDWAANSEDWGSWTRSVGHMVELEFAFHMFDPTNQS
jgi:hypothetical protein